ncbi:MAG TPA: SRPBCC family protein [Vicinamibacterales bacterium]
MSTRHEFPGPPHPGDWRMRGAPPHPFADDVPGATEQLHAKNGRPEGLAGGLGWMSLALGAAATAAPDRVAHLVGLPEERRTRTIVRAVGLREIASGTGILARGRPAGWLWTRVAGDVMDLALVSTAFRRDHVNTRRLTVAAGAVAGLAALDMLVARAMRRETPVRATHEVSLLHTITINRPAAGLYRFWRDLRNLPRFMRHLRSVAVLDDRRSQWRARAPAGMTVSWDAEITDDVPNERIAWRARPGSRVPNHGYVEFAPAPGGHGTEVRVHLAYQPPAGRLGRAVAKLFGEDPDWQVRDDLRRFKQLMEVGEIPVSESSFTRGGPARPPRRRRRWLRRRSSRIEVRP